MAKGRPPKAAALRVIEGNPGKRPIPNTPKPEPKIPTAPRWLSKNAKTEWRRIMPELERLNLATQIDRGALAGYCENLSAVQAAETALQTYADKNDGSIYYETDTGQLKPHPAVQVARGRWTLVKQFAEQFGLTPSARSRLTGLEPPADDECERCGMPPRICGHIQPAATA